MSSDVGDVGVGVGPVDDDEQSRLPDFILPDDESSESTLGKHKTRGLHVEDIQRDRDSWLVVLGAPGQVWGIRVPWEQGERVKANFPVKDWDSLSEVQRRQHAFREAKYEARHWLTELSVRGNVRTVANVKREEWVMAKLAGSSFKLSGPEPADVRQLINDPLLAGVPIKLAGAVSVACAVWDSRRAALSRASLASMFHTSTATLARWERKSVTGYLPVPVRGRS